MRTHKYLGYELAIFDNDALCNEFVRRNEYENHLTEVLRKVVEPSSTVLDGGCHLGFHTILFAQLAKDGVVHAFDINEEALTLLKYTITQNNLTNIKVHNAGLSETSKTVTYSKNIHPDQNSLYESYSKVFVGEAQARLVTLDSLNLNSLDFLKLDIEGSELDALKGGLNTLQKHKPVIIYEHLKHNEDPSILLNELGYELYQIEQSRDFIAIPLEGRQGTREKLLTY